MNYCKVLVKPFMVKKPGGMPMRTMFGTIVNETAKAIQVKLYCKPEKSSVCLHCNRKLTHPISKLYGLGPICGQHYYIAPFQSEEALEEGYNELDSKLKSITWEGWIPKSLIMDLERLEDSAVEEQRFEVSFKFDGQLYKSVVGKENLNKIRHHSEEIVELVQIS
ncbi:gp639 [Bacillus phage G]|uniref:Gp639 n=1 Tax=Bacillus phage G TaxID=2884420 RepID=G3MB19_9CAUD|nr:gp639 [Bacillus phage G]AEO93883.1 gp639 [Bacillus phage G]